MKNRVLCSAAVAALVLTSGACSSSRREAAASATPGCPDEKAAASGHGGDHAHYTGTGEQVRVVNAYCPIAGSHAVGKDGRTDKNLTREWNGRTVGFCCGNCLPEWDAMSDRQREAALAAVSGE